nr:putative ribonuclease H-like domain-containing protein [Tanacetum cinerariifolium]
MILESVEHGPLLWPSVTEDGETRLKKYSKLSSAEAIQADCDVKATNIILQALPPEIYALERECKLYDAFDKFAYQKGETLRDFYLRFSLILNDMNMCNMKLEQFQVNTKFLNTLPPEWSKFVTGVKLSLPYTTSYHTPQFVSQGSSSSNLSISYLMNDTSLTINHNAYKASAPQIDYALIAHHPLEFSSPKTRLVVSCHKQPALNIFQPSSANNNQLWKGYYPTNSGEAESNVNWFIKTVASRSGGTSRRQRVIVCYNYKGKGHIAKQCTKAKRKRNAEWFKDKVLLVQAQANGQVLQEEELDFLADPGTAESSTNQSVALMENLSHYISDNLAENSTLPALQDDLILSVIEQLKTQVVNCTKINKDNKQVNELLTAELERYRNQERVLKEQMNDNHASTSYEHSLEIETLKHTLIFKTRTTATAIIEGTWGFEHTKACFRDDIIPFVKSLNELFTSFDQYLMDEVTEVQNVFTLMELAVEQHCEEKTKVQIKMENVLQENNRLLTQALSVEIVNIVEHANMKSVCLNVTACARCRDTLSSQESALTFAELFKINNLKAQAQAKDTVILKLKEKLNSLNGDVKDRNVKRDVEEIETLNIELDHKVDVAPLVPKLRKNRTAHTDYIRHTQEEAATLREIVESERLLSPLNTSLVYAWKFCDSDLEVAFRQHTCFIRKLNGVDLLTGSRGNNLYTLSIQYMMASSPICLLSKASKTKSWLWHRCLSHLNFGAINYLARQGLVRGLLKLKFEKDHLCSACAMGKSTRKTHKPKSEDTNQEKLYLLHMDLCGPMRVESVNGKKYILVIVDDYSRFTWVKFLRSKDETLDFIIKFLKMIQVRLKVPVRRIQTDNGTEFVNQTLRDYYEEVGISHETSVARSPRQNGVVERRYRTLIEAARTMLIYAQAPLFLWAEAVATACFTQN